MSSFWLKQKELLKYTVKTYSMVYSEMVVENHHTLKTITDNSNLVVTATLKAATAHLPLLRCVFLRDRRAASSADSGSRFPVLEFPVHWPAAMSRRQLKNDDRCPQNNLTSLHTPKKKYCAT